MNILSGNIRIDTKLSKNFFDIYNESRGFAINKSRILKAKKIKGLNYISYLFIFFIVIFVIDLLVIFKSTNYLITTYAFMFIVLDIILFIMGLCRIYLNYIYRNKNRVVNSMLINRKGITDLSSFRNVEMLFLWDRVEGIVVGEYSVVIYLGGSIYLYFNKKDKKKIIDGVKKYKKDILIIDN